MTCPHSPRTLYEINTRVWLAELGVERLAAVPDAVLDALAAQGFDLVWLMGVWLPSATSTREARALEGLRGDYARALPDGTEADVVGSPYAIAGYEVSPLLGGPGDLADLRARLRRRGIGLLLDFVPNHTACDHPFLDRHSEYYVLAVEGPGAPGPGDAFATAAGARVFHGRDPYFPPWSDTAQLDYRRASTRRAMIEELGRVAAQCDGVRCDMAMLLLTDVFARTWTRPGAAAPPEADLAAQAEFWPEAIDAVRRAHPGFVFMAEAYWGTEARLQQLGFDWTYDKALYDALVAGDAGQVNAHLGAGRGRQRRAVRFLENHDEERAAHCLAQDLHPVAAVCALTLPGVRLLHHGQLEGARRRLPVQLARRAREPVDAAIAAFYQELLATLGDPVLRQGAWRLLAAAPAWEGNPSHGAFVVYGWDGSLLGGDGSHRLLVANLAPHRAQCRVRLALPGLGGRRVRLRERFSVGATPPGDTRADDGRPVYHRDGDALGREGLYIDLPGRAAQLLRLPG